MRSTEEITGDIGKTKTKLKTLEQSVLNKQKELAKLKESHTQWVESNIGKERMPKSLGKQRESMLSLSLEIENLQIVQGNLESKLADLQLELARSELYENTVQAYRQAEQLFAEKAEMVVQEIIQLNRKMQSCRDSVEGFLEQSGNPLEILRSLVNDPALSGLSLRDFFIGQVAEGGAEENAAFMQELVQVYRELARKLPILTDIRDAWVMLSDRLDFVSSAATGLVPSSKRYTFSQQSPPQVKEHNQTIQIHPKNLIAADANRQREIDAVQRKIRGIRVVNANRIMASK